MIDLDATRVRDVLSLWLGRVGDLIVATPALRAIRRRFPLARHTLVTSRLCAATAALIPFVDETVVHRPRALASLAAVLLGRRHDLLVDLNPSASKTSAALSFLARSPIKLSFKKGRLDGVFTHQVAAPARDEHMLDRYARLAAALAAEYEDRLELRLPPAAEAEADAILARSGLAPLPGKLTIVIHAGNFKKYDHRWPEEKFAALTGLLLKEPGVRLAYLAGPGEEAPTRAIVAPWSHAPGSDAPGCDAVPLLPSSSLGVVGALLRKVDLAILSVTGTMHLAAAVGTPTFGFYSGYADKVWRPRGPQHAGLVSREWTSCRDIAVDDAYAWLREVLARLRRAKII
ncbi:MAG: glycosyltransferase family 9 protein [Elusimicrobia bacterium]|nr:glycosyltransferase family 9 protein [Elusimicrobiota bacterium]